MCLGIPGQVVKIAPDRPDLAEVEIRGTRRLINLGLLEDELVVPGDWVLIHVGFALSKIDPEEAEAALGFLESLGQADQLEAEELRSAVPAGGEQEEGLERLEEAHHG